MPMNGDWFQSHFESDGGNGARCRQVIFAALDMANVEKMKQQTVRHAIVMGGLFFALGAAGLVCLVIFQGYRSARSSLSRIRAFSGEVIANMPAGLITLDTDLEITSHNDAAMEILGDRKNRPGTMVLPPEMAGMVTRLGEKGKKMAGEIQCTVLSDPPLLLDVTASTICSGGGAVSGYLFLFHDLTELKTLKQEIDRSRRLAAVGKLAAGVAHEIRNPLSSIKGFATYFFERDGALQADRDVARIMVQEVERLNRAVTQLLEFARPVPVEKKKVAIETIVGHSLRLIAHDLEKHNVSVKTRIDTARTHLHTDPDRVNQILLNLYLNALQAMDKAGELSVTVREGPHENRVIIEVADTGRGIPGKDLDHIFDPYFTTRSDGTGLGLAMVYRAVEALGGEIRIQSVPGQGTRVVIELPAG